MRMAKETHNPRQGRTPRNDDLPMQCWCRQEIIPVSRERVRECSGVSCGRDGCEAPAT